MRDGLIFTFLLIIVGALIFSNPPPFMDDDLFGYISNCHMTRKEREETEKNVREIIEKSGKNVTTRYEKLLYAVQWIKENVKPNTTTWEDYIREGRTAYGALKTGETVCTGFCQLLREFCKQWEIPSYIIACKYKGAEEWHVMLAVKMEDKKLYFIDITRPNIGTEQNPILMGKEQAGTIFECIVKKYDFYDITGERISAKNYKIKSAKKNKG